MKSHDRGKPVYGMMATASRFTNVCVMDSPFSTCEDWNGGPRKPVLGPQIVRHYTYVMGL